MFALTAASRADLAGAQVRFEPLAEGAPVPTVFHTTDPKQEFPKERVTAEVWADSVAGRTGTLGKPSSGSVTVTLDSGKRLWFKAAAESEEDLAALNATLVAMKPVSTGPRQKRGDDWHYKMLEEYRAQGDLLKLSDDSLTEMSFHIRYPAKQIYENLVRLVGRSKFPLESASDQGGMFQVTTGYYSQDVGFMAQVFSGASRVRFKMYAKVVPDGPHQCFLNAQVTCEAFQRGGLFSGNQWEDYSAPQARDLIRTFATNSITMARYPNDYGRVTEDYIAGGPLPPPLPEAPAWVADSRPAEPPPPPPPTPEQLADRAERARGFLQRSTELDKLVAGLRTSSKKTPLREAVGYAVLYGEQAQKLLDELKDGGLETPAQTGTEAALASQVDRLAALRAAYEFEEQYGKGPAAARWAEVKTADQHYKQALQAAFRACSNAATAAPATEPGPSGEDATSAPEETPASPQDTTGKEGAGWP